MYSHYGRSYVDAILEENPRSLLMA
jgi:hypothetical protein